MPTLSSVPEDVAKVAEKFIDDHHVCPDGKDCWCEKATEIAREDLTALINQQIKSALDELEKSLPEVAEHICRFNDGEQVCDCYKEADDIAKSTIQKIRSRYDKTKATDR